ncbi:hypothetical protein PR048_003640 [Dryococelus australis]|uniref:Uncharacterized protein n=1 Tax=Dryococelus australis TaxID=614101 RepID=A0ABQ9INL4_9NEOP|nr:hypothetical protein PR048_003640 [Dryococelus australis]
MGNRDQDGWAMIRYQVVLNENSIFRLFRFGSSASLWSTTVVPVSDKGTLFSAPLHNCGKKGMRCCRTLWITLSIQPASCSSITFSYAIHKDHVCVFRRRVLNHVNRRHKGAKVQPTRLHTNIGTSETLLFPPAELDERYTRLEMVAAWKRYVSRHGFLFKRWSTQSPLQVLGTPAYLEPFTAFWAEKRGSDKGDTARASSAPSSLNATLSNDEQCSISTACRDQGGRAVSLLACHQGDPGSIPSRVTPGFSHVGIVPDDTVGQRVFFGDLPFPRPFISALLLTHLNHPHRLSRPRWVAPRDRGQQLLKRRFPEARPEPPTKANRVRSPAGSLPDFRMGESCRTMPLVGGFCRGNPVSPVLSFRRCFMLTSLHRHRLPRPCCYEPPKSRHTLIFNSSSLIENSKPIQIENKLGNSQMVNEEKHMHAVHLVTSFHIC